MKVVLFCGGFGMRLREHSESTPKPMVRIGRHPILWHIMKYYAHFGHKEFILCLGWKSEVIRGYFQAFGKGDFRLPLDFGSIGAGEGAEGDFADWSVTFADTGAASSIGQRLRAVRSHLAGEEVFLANYTDGLSDLHLPDLIALREKRKAVAAFVSVRPTQSFHAVVSDSDGCVKQLQQIGDTDTWMNGGYFVMTPEIFDYIRDGEDLVNEPFLRLIQERRLVALKHNGFWSCMDTYKEKQMLDEMVLRNDTPWAVWKDSQNASKQTRLSKIRSGSSILRSAT